MSTCSGRTTVTLPSGVTIISSTPRPCGRWGQWPRQAARWEEGWDAGKEGSILVYLCPALGPGGAGSAQGHHGAAADEPGLVWHRLGHCQEVYLCCLFPPGSQAQGEPSRAMAPLGLILLSRAEVSCLIVQPCRSGLPPKACVKTVLDWVVAQMCSVLQCSHLLHLFRRESGSM